jgi:hypothetical protein
MGVVGVVLSLTVGVPLNTTAGKVETPTVPVTFALTLPCTGSGVFTTLTGIDGTGGAAMAEPVLIKTNVVARITKPDVGEKSLASCFMLLLLEPGFPFWNPDYFC